jgi:hypothetical protein
VYDPLPAGAFVTATVVSVGLAGELPPGHAYADLASRATDPATLEPFVLAPTMRNERKVRVLVEAAYRALAGTMSARPQALQRCAFVVVSRWDGQPTNLIDADTSKVASFAEMSPSTVAFSFIPHMAASCVPHFFKVRGPAVSLGSRQGLAAGWLVAERWLGRSAELALVIESDLALPSVVPSELRVPSDYALAVLLGSGGRGR